MTAEEASALDRIVEADPPTARLNDAVWNSLAVSFGALATLTALAVGAETGAFPQWAEALPTLVWAFLTVTFFAWMRPVSVMFQKFMNVFRDRLDIGHHALIFLLFWIVSTTFVTPTPGSELPSLLGTFIGLGGPIFGAAESANEIIEYALRRLGVDVDNSNSGDQRTVHERYVDGDIDEDELEKELEQELEGVVERE
ncbi:hypothetical protein HPS36_02025 [Halorubrum salinarum]|uniref:Uncharacterized protein n=1 Tax=Halorubrum salinarum TaxID=2739057 RepID=A0A7D4BQP6_9EURY|nr:hypothetical protein [Halorubrum salinarum]QKG91680.1 hypothetical protein HPS36_02025 [Halorubrum salinarum]